jgi:hypothetical protein
MASAKAIEVSMGRKGGSIRKEGRTQNAVKSMMGLEFES